MTSLEANELDRAFLKGLRVLSEAATGYRRITPVLAALAGADQGYAVGRDSARVSRREAEEQTAYFAGLARVERTQKIGRATKGDYLRQPGRLSSYC